MAQEGKPISDPEAAVGTVPITVTSVQQLCFRSKQLDPQAGLQAVGVLLRDARMLAAWQGFFHAWQDTSDALRTTFHRDVGTGSVTGLVHPEGADLNVLLSPARDVGEAKAMVDRCLDDYESHLDRLPLSRHYAVPLEDGSYFVLVVSEHIIHDGGTVEVAFAALGEITMGRDPLDLVADARPYRAFAELERQLVEGPETVDRLAWWKTHLEGARPVALPATGARHGRVNGVLALPRVAPWPPPAPDEKASAFDVVSAALLVALSTHVDDAPVVFNMPWARRPALPPEFHRTAGNMVEYLPLCLRYDPNMRFRELVAEVAQRRRAARANVLPLAFLLDELGMAWEDDPTPLLQVMVNLIPPVAAPLLLDPEPKALPLADRVELHPGAPIGRTLERHDVGLAATATRRGLRWRLSMRRDLFAPAVHDEIDETLEAVVGRALADMGSRLVELV